MKVRLKASKGKQTGNSDADHHHEENNRTFQAPPEEPEYVWVLIIYLDVEIRDASFWKSMC